MTTLNKWDTDSKKSLGYKAHIRYLKISELLTKREKADVDNIKNKERIKFLNSSTEEYHKLKEEISDTTKTIKELDSEIKSLTNELNKLKSEIKKQGFGEE